MLRTGLFVLLVVALVGCSSATSSTTSSSLVATATADAASTAPTVDPTAEATSEPTAGPRAATDFIVSAADVPSTYGALTGLELSGPNSPSEITPETLADWEEASDAATILGQGFVNGYRANFGYGGTDLYSAAYVFDNAEGSLAHQADAVAGFVVAGCTDVSNDVATIGDASGALRCPAFGSIEPQVWIIFATDNAVATVRITAMFGDTEPNLELMAEIANNLQARAAG